MTRSIARTSATVSRSNPPKVILEKIVTENSNLTYSTLPKQWLVQDIKSFSKNKELYPYQLNALERLASVLYLSFNSFNGTQLDFSAIESEYNKYGFNPHPLNRACFWMATGSGKTLVLIKTIEHIDYLMAQGLIPKKEIMLLLPKDDLITQLEREVFDYNQSHIGRIIELINLAKYEEDKHNHQPTFLDAIKVYYYRSDLLRDERKETILDYKTYENDGNWYVFLDEAHRGDSENSNLKDYVNRLSTNGFLFNFSATFIDAIDIITTCYNFNLEKFITAGYGKNIYLSNSKFTLGKGEDEFSEFEKQKQVLKSFLIYTIISKSKKIGSYHSPLIMTLVNSINKNDKGKDSDLKLFCNYMLKIAQEDPVAVNTFGSAKQELISEFSNGVKYIFGKENLLITSAEIMAITLTDIREEAFNSKTKGDLEYYEGVKGKEIVFKLQTSSKPFALIRVGDAGAFIKNYLKGYHKLSTFVAKDWFSELNSVQSSIKVLLGSRAFYEGWDSNRPNIINFINIGKGEARKFVPQSIGRGIRIQPNPTTSNRKRLPLNDPGKNKLLETLFIFSSDVKSVKVILEAMTELSGKSAVKESIVLHEEHPELFEISQKNFELLLPVYKEKERTSATALEFHIEDGCKERFKNIFSDMSPATFLVSSNRSYSDNWDIKKYIALKEFVEDSKLVSDSSKTFYSYNYLVSDLRRHIMTNEKDMDGVRLIKEKELDESSNDIIHFKHIEVQLNDIERKKMIDELTIVKNFGKLTKTQIQEQCPFDNSRATDVKYISDYRDEIAKLAGEQYSTFVSNGQTLNINNLANHYYKPLLFSDTDTIDWINHIIRQDSERVFIKNLIKHLDSEKVESEWMFSKIDETLDKNIAIPYFADNQYKNFYPDFIFWIKRGNDYRIVFIDPKGSAYTDYERKVDGFEKLFSGKKFKYKSYDVTFELKLVGSYSGGQKYSSYWVLPTDFSWLC